MRFWRGHQYFPRSLFRGFSLGVVELVGGLQMRGFQFGRREVIKRFGGFNYP